MVDGDTKIAQPYFDEATGKMKDVELTIRDHLFLKFLKAIAGALSK